MCKVIRTLHFIGKDGYPWLHPTKEINVAAKYMRKYVPSNSTNQTKVSFLHVAYKLCVNHVRYYVPIVGTPNSTNNLGCWIYKIDSCLIWLANLNQNIVDSSFRIAATI